MSNALCTTYRWVVAWKISDKDKLIAIIAETVTFGSTAEKKFRKYLKEHNFHFSFGSKGFWNACERLREFEENEIAKNERIYRSIVLVSDCDSEWFIENSPKEEEK